MKSHTTSKVHLGSCRAALQSSPAGGRGAVVQQLQTPEEDKESREAVKAPTGCSLPSLPGLASH